MSAFELGCYGVAVAASTALFDYGVYRFLKAELNCLPVALVFAVIYGVALKSTINQNVLRWINEAPLMFVREKHPLENRIPPTNWREL